MPHRLGPQWAKARDAISGAVDSTRTEYHEFIQEVPGKRAQKVIHRGLTASGLLGTTAVSALMMLPENVQNAIEPWDATGVAAPIAFGAFLGAHGRLTSNEYRRSLPTSDRLHRPTGKQERKDIPEGYHSWGAYWDDKDD